MRRARHSQSEFNHWSHIGTNSERCLASSHSSSTSSLLSSASSSLSYGTNCPQGTIKPAYQTR